jgi:phenylacetate-CoA ligase
VKLQDRIYLKLPVLLQHAAVSAFGYGWKKKRFGGIFEREVAGFIARERFTREAWRAYQTTALRELLKVAVRSVPYYQKAYRGLGLDDRAIDRFGLEDLVHLPIVEKDAVRADPEAFLVGGKPTDDLTICPTSGSTGTPVRTYWSPADFQRSLALRESRECRPAGVSYRDPRATFSGRIVVPTDSTGPFYRFNVFERQVYCSAFHISPRNAERYIEAYDRHHTVWGTGYTHAFFELAHMMKAQGIPRPKWMRAIITTSEKLTEEGRAIIEERFGCRVYQEYGMVEDTIFASEHADRKMRLSPDAGIAELLDKDDRPLPEEAGAEGVVVGTNFVRRCQPLIRYRLGDVAVWDRQDASTGFDMPIFKEIIGRIEDVIYAPDGRRTVRFHGIFTELVGAREAQVIQEAIDRVRVKVVPSPEYSQATAQEIEHRIQTRLTRAMRVIVEPVEQIPRTSSGKLKAVVSLIQSPPPDGQSAVAL